jgi:CcmD family protein
MSLLHLAAPALPLHSAGKYVAAAYIVFVALILIYVAIMARRLNRTERELEQLKTEAQPPKQPEPANTDADRDPEPVR